MEDFSQPSPQPEEVQQQEPPVEQQEQARKRRSMWVAIGAILLGAIVISAGRAQGASNVNFNPFAFSLLTATPTPTPRPTPLVTPTPLPSPSPSTLPNPVFVEGSVLSISSTPVSFMNARLVMIAPTQSADIALYVPPTAQITNSTGGLITLNDVRVGDVVQAIGRPYNAGILVSQMQVVKPVATPTPRPTPTSLPAATPTPIPSPSVNVNPL